VKLPSSASEHRAHGTRTFREQETGKITAEQETSLKQLSEATKISKVDTPSENIYKGKKKLERNPLKNTESHRGYEKQGSILAKTGSACIKLMMAGDTLYTTDFGRRLIRDPWRVDFEHGTGRNGMGHDGTGTWWDQWRLTTYTSAQVGPLWTT
jgi:hypothetical protein